MIHQIYVHQKIQSYSIYFPRNHQQLHPQEIFHKNQDLFQTINKHKLRSDQLKSIQLLLDKYLSCSSSIHPKKELINLFKSLWASLFSKDFLSFTEDKYFDTPNSRDAHFRLNCLKNIWRNVRLKPLGASPIIRFLVIPHYLLRRILYRLIILVMVVF